MAKQHMQTFSSLCVFMWQRFFYRKIVLLFIIFLHSNRLQMPCQFHTEMLLWTRCGLRRRYHNKVWTLRWTYVNGIHVQGKSGTFRTCEEGNHDILCKMHLLVPKMYAKQLLYNSKLKCSSELLSKELQYCIIKNLLHGNTEKTYLFHSMEGLFPEYF